MRSMIFLFVISFLLSACGGSTSVDNQPTGSQIKLQKSATGVSLLNPKSGDIVKSPLTITGTAPGTWFSEGVLPVSLVDANGKLITSGNAEASGEWMTTEPVSFSTILTFSAQKGEGKIVIQKDNPSGDSERAMKQEFPIKF